MTDPSSPDYYRRREQQSRALAARAAAPQVKRIHEELADHYVRLAEEAEAKRDRRPRLHLVSTAGPGRR